MGQIDRRFAALRVRPFRIGEAGLADCGGRVDGIGDSQPLGNDPVSALVAVAAIAFSVLASAFFVVANLQRAGRPGPAGRPGRPGRRGGSGDRMAEDARVMAGRPA